MPICILHAVLGPGHNREPVFSSYLEATSKQSLRHRAADHCPAITLCLLPVTRLVVDDDQRFRIMREQNFSCDMLPPCIRMDCTGASAPNGGNKDFALGLISSIFPLTDFIGVGVRQMREVVTTAAKRPHVGRAAPRRIRKHRRPSNPNTHHFSTRLTGSVLEF